MSKLIKGFENYSIDRQGNVFNHITGTFKTPTSNKSGKGYMFVDLYSKGKHKRKYVHRLVAEAFIPNPENKSYINHKDGNSHNNNVDNLEWCTPLENVEHASKVLGVMKGYARHAEKCKRKIYAYDYYTNECLGQFNSIVDCAKTFNLNRANITQNAQSKYKKQLKGMFFLYEEDLGVKKPTIRHERNDISVEMVIRLKNQGLTHKEIANKLNCSCGVIQNRLLKV